jgi:hypothetical protein
MSNGTRKITRDRRVVKILNWIISNIKIGEEFKAIDIAKKFNLTTNDVVRTFPRISGIKNIGVGIWTVFEYPTLGD